MGEEARDIARGTTINEGDMVLSHTRVFELTPVRSRQVEMNLRSEIAVSGSALIQEQQWILDVNRIRVKHLCEQLIGIAEL